MKKLALSVKEASEMLGISKTRMYELTEMAGFPVIQVGRRKVIPKAEFKQWVSHQAAANKEI